MGLSSIEWTDYTFNPWWGCAEVSPGCGHCYARTWANWTRGKGLWPEHGQPSDDHAIVVTSDANWREPLKWNRKAEREGVRYRVFCASMADVFEDRSELIGPRIRLFDLIDLTPNLDWQVLTKRPEVAHDWLDAYRPHMPIPNVWLGVSIENARYTWRADVLRQIPAAVRFISAEPLLGSLFVGGATRGAPGEPHSTSESGTGRAAATAAGPSRDGNRGQAQARASLDLTGIDWIIIGGESGPGARPFHLEHAREIIRETQAMCSANCELHPLFTHDICYSRPAVFVKQLGAKPLTRSPFEGNPIPMDALRDRKGGDWDEWPADLRIREFPRSSVEAVA